MTATSFIAEKIDAFAELQIVPVDHSDNVLLAWIAGASHRTMTSHDPTSDLRS